MTRREKDSKLKEFDRAIKEINLMKRLLIHPDTTEIPEHAIIIIKGNESLETYRMGKGKIVYVLSKLLHNLLSSNP